MRRTRAVSITALVAASAMVFAACSSTPGQQSSTSAATSGGSSTSAAPGTSSDTGSSTTGASSSAATGASTAPSSGSAASGGDGCGKPHGPYADPGAASGTVVTGQSELATAWNSIASHDNSIYNAIPAYFTQAQVWYYDKDQNLMNNDSFVKCEVTSKSPLTVKYTVNKDAKWSDGVPITAEDLLLTWVSQSNFNTTSATDKDGNLIPNPKGIAFDASAPGLQLITKFPEISADHKSITTVFSKPFVDYTLNMNINLPVHVLAQKALKVADPAKATDAFVTAFKEKDEASMKKIADFWNTGFDFTELPADKSLYLSSGPYLLTGFKKDQFMTFEVNPDYTWGPKASVKTITYQFLPDPTASVQSMANGEVAIIEPSSPTTDVTKGLAGLSGQGVKSVLSPSGSYEHVDLVHDNGGPFDPKTYGGDKEKAKAARLAFLMTIPRESIVDRLMKPIDPKATVRDSFTSVPGSPGYDAIVKANGMSAYDKVDIAGAKAMLAKAGVTSLKVRFLYSSKKPVRAQEYQLIAESAKQAGITVVDGKDPDWSSHLDNRQNYDASLFGWQNSNAGISQQPPNFLGLDKTNKDWGPNNHGHYSSPAVNAAMNELNTTTDPAKQQELLQTSEKELVADGFGTVLYQTPDVVGYDSTKVTGVSSIPFVPGVFYNFWEWKAAS